MSPNLFNTLETSHIEISKVADDEVSLPDFIEQSRTQSSILSRACNFATINKSAGVADP